MLPRDDDAARVFIYMLLYIYMRSRDAAMLLCIILLPSRYYTAAVGEIMLLPSRYYTAVVGEIMLLPSRYYTAAVAILYCCRRDIILLSSRYYTAVVAICSDDGLCVLSRRSLL